MCGKIVYNPNMFIVCLFTLKICFKWSILAKPGLWIFPWTFAIYFKIGVMTLSTPHLLITLPNYLNIKTANNTQTHSLTKILWWRAKSSLIVWIFICLKCCLFVCHFLGRLVDRKLANLHRLCVMLRSILTIWFENHCCNNCSA